MKKRSLFLGRGTIAVNCLEILYKKDELPAVIICDTNDVGEDTWTKSLFKAALDLGFKNGENLFNERRVNRPDFIDKLKPLGPFDIIFSIQPYAIFRMPFIELSNNVVNMHMAPLPKLRGVAPCSHAILDNLSEMGVSLHLIEDEGIDNGPLLYQEKFPLTEEDTAWTLFNHCVETGTNLFKTHVDDLLRGKFNPILQIDDDMSYHPMGEIDFSQCEVPLHRSAEEVSRFIRSRIFPPFQLPYFLYKGDKIYIEHCRLAGFTKNKDVISFDTKKYQLNFPDGSIIIDRYYKGSR